MDEPTWIARRALNDPQGGPDVEVRIGIPTDKGPPDDWECPYMLIEEGHEPVLETGYGIDGFQALIQALEGIRVKLARMGRSQLRWLNFEPGFTGFTRIIPFTFGLTSVRELEALVEEEYQRHGHDAAAGKRGRPYGDS